MRRVKEVDRFDVVDEAGRRETMVDYSVFGAIESVDGKREWIRETGYYQLLSGVRVNEGEEDGVFFTVERRPRRLRRP